MTKTGHRLTGIMSASLLLMAFPEIAHLTVVPCVMGATAPDWLEIAWRDKATGERLSVIPHRTITHWLVLWVVLFAYCLYQKSTMFGAIGLGFAVGGLTHLLFDVPNPTGIPVLNPFKNSSLNLWKSGRNEWALILVVALIVVSVFVIKVKF